MGDCNWKPLATKWNWTNIRKKNPNKKKSANNSHRLQVDCSFKWISYRYLRHGHEYTDKNCSTIQCVTNKGQISIKYSKYFCHNSKWFPQNKVIACRKTLQFDRPMFDLNYFLIYKNYFYTLANYWANMNYFCVAIANDLMKWQRKFTKSNSIKLYNFW